MQDESPSALGFVSVMTPGSEVLAVASWTSHSGVGENVLLVSFHDMATVQHYLAVVCEGRTCGWKQRGPSQEEEG